MSFLTFLSAVTYTAMCSQYMYIQHIFPCDQCKDTGIWGIISASDASDTMLLCQALICLEDFALQKLGPIPAPGSWCSSTVLRQGSQGSSALQQKSRTITSVWEPNLYTTAQPQWKEKHKLHVAPRGQGATKYKLPCVSLKCPKQCHINT